MKRKHLILMAAISMFFWQCGTTQKSQTQSSTNPTETSSYENNEVAIQGGMWIPNEVNIASMNRMGLKLDVDDLFNKQQTGLNMAIPHFNGGCTSELISPKGLLLTNHHCGYGQIQSHSTLENNYLEDGFWAYSMSEELPNENTTATFVLSITEVTDQIIRGTENLDATTQLKQRQENIARIQKNTALEPFQEVVIKPFFDGNKYYKIITENYPDVRLVGAPPSSIGKFGSDTDNWMWPRHTGDFSLFRIYANKDNKPAEYSEDNIPYQPKRHLKVSLAGIEKDDFTMVYGFPGRTKEYLPAIAVQNITEVRNPQAIAVRKIALDILDEKMRKDEATRIKYASKYARISNYYKKWIGENLGIKKTNAIEKKLKYQEVLKRNLNTNPTLFNQYGKVLPVLNSLHQQQASLIVPKTLFDEIFTRNSETLLMAFVANRLVQSQGTPNYDRTKEWAKGFLKSRYKDYDSELDQQVTIALIDYFQSQLPNDYLSNELRVKDYELRESWKNSAITGNLKVNGVSMQADIDQAFENDDALMKVLENDPMVQLVAGHLANYQMKTSEPYAKLQDQIDQKQKEYMALQMKVLDKVAFYPDANSTLRITYGKVDPYTNGEGVTYPYQTYLKGVMEKYKPGDYEFDVDEKLRNLYASKDFGDYAQEGKMPVNFIASNHTTGGNSGSPALDSEGNLIGLNFDRVWEGTMSDLNYDPSICRNIMVDARYIMFIIDKYADAQNLIEEIEFIKE